MRIEFELEHLFRAMQRGGAQSVSRMLDSLHIQTWAPHDRVNLMSQLLVMAVEFNHFDTAELALSCSDVHQESMDRALKLAMQNQASALVGLLMRHSGSKVVPGGTTTTTRPHLRTN